MGRRPTPASVAAKALEVLARFGTDLDRPIRLLGVALSLESPSPEP